MGQSLTRPKTCSIVSSQLSLVQALFSFPKPFSPWAAQFLLLTEPGGLMYQQSGILGQGQSWRARALGQPFYCQNTIPLSKQYWKYLHFPGLVLQNPKGEQSNFKIKDSVFEDRSCFMFPYVLLFTSPLARWILFACLVIKLVEQSATQKATVAWCRAFKSIVKDAPFLPARVYLWVFALAAVVVPGLKYRALLALFSPFFIFEPQ